MILRAHQKIRSRYRQGDVIPVKVIEHIDGDSWIVSFEGDLIRVQNSSQQKFREGAVISMRLISVDPPQLIVV